MAALTPTFIRLPKWLVDERYVLSYNPDVTECYTVTLFHPAGSGQAQTIGKAAKLALAARGKHTKP